MNESKIRAILEGEEIEIVTLDIIQSESSWAHVCCNDLGMFVSENGRCCFDSRFDANPAPRAASGGAHFPAALGGLVNSFDDFLR